MRATHIRRKIICPHFSMFSAQSIFKIILQSSLKDCIKPNYLRTGVQFYSRLLLNWTVLAWHKATRMQNQPQSGYSGKKITSALDVWKNIPNSPLLNFFPAFLSVPQLYDMRQMDTRQWWMFVKIHHSTILLFLWSA